MARPKKSAPKQAAPKQAAPKQAAPKQAAPKQAPQTPSSTSTSTSMAQTFDPLNYMTAEELVKIDTQLAVALKGADVLLFWTGVEWAHVQRWAKIWKLKTLTIAMGPLMDPANPNSPKAQKSKKVYSRENNTYQHLEEPILKGLYGDPPVRRIDYVHPTVDGAAHVTYQAWPCDKTDDWFISYGEKTVNKWKKLSWSYESLITTSQLNLMPLQKQILPIASMLRIQTPQPSIQPVDMAVNTFLSSSDNLPNSIANDTDVEHTMTEDRDVAQPQQDTDLFETGQLSAALDIRGHESRIFPRDSRPSEPASSDGHLTGTQVRDQVDQRIDFHEEELFCELDRSPTPVYTIKRCGEPVPPITLPVVCIDDIAIGGEVTVNVGKNGANKDFLFLTMKSTSELEKWWKMSWV
ncbi:hypothetical protein LTR51_000006 [Lithohypha guttulata]|nr:hypothetical protein LTR51_000006 [Lithohypha guttulata]